MKMIFKTTDCHRSKSRTNSNPYHYRSITGRYRSITGRFKTGYSRSVSGTCSFNIIKMSVSVSWLERITGSRCG